MPLDRPGAISVAKELFPKFLSQRAKAQRLDKWVTGSGEPPSMPAQSTREYKELQGRSSTPYLGLVVTTAAQALYVEGHRRPKSADNSKSWTTHWQPNGLDGRQIAVHRAALSHGVSYVRTLRGTDPLTGGKMSVMRGLSAKRAAAFYQDESEDDYPLWAIQAEKTASRDSRGHVVKNWMIQLFDENEIQFLSCDEDGDGKWEFIETRRHDMGVVPFVRFANMLDLDGRATGEVEPFIPLAARIDQDTFDRLIVQRFGAWKVRWIAGMAKPETLDEQRAAALALKIEDLLISDNAATKFGTLDATSLDGFISAREADIKDLAAVTQTPPHHLLGLSPNLSAEALAAAEAALMRKIEERKHLFGESWEQVMRLGAWAAGDDEGAKDFSSEVRWADIESRSLAQVADALGKLSTQLGIPPQALWDRIPGWTENDTAAAKEMLVSIQADEALMNELLGQAKKDPNALESAA